MIHTPARAIGPTNRSQAIMVSEAANTTAPTAASTFPVAIAVATIAPITTMYTATGGTNCRSACRTAGRIRRASTPITSATNTAATEEGDDCGPVGPETGDVAEVRDEERGQTGDEPVAREHEEHVAREREHQRGDEPTAAGVGAGNRVRRHGHDDEAHHRHRLADVFDTPPRG